MRCLLAALALVPVLVGCGGEDEQVSRDRFDADRAYRDVEAQVEIGPRPAGSTGARRTARLIATRLRDAGADGVRLQRPHRNVVARIPGRSPGAIVVGAHYDTKDDVPAPFAGANDGASGVAVVLELARVLAADAPLEGPSVHLALFDAEEARADREFSLDGLRGSRQYVDYAAGARQGTPPLDGIEAMVLFDMVGDCDLAIPREGNSDPALYEAFGDAAPFGGEAAGVLDDHTPFQQAGVPAVDLIDFRFGPGPSPGEWWHSPEDTLDKVCAGSLDAVGEAALEALGRIG